MKKLIIFLLLTLTLVGGWLVRLDDIAYRAAHQDGFQVEGAPLLRGVDGYFFLERARKIVQGEADFSGSRHTDPPPRITPLSVQALVWGSRMFAVEPLEVALQAGPLLGPLIGLPLFFIGRRLSGHLGGLVAAMVGVFSPYYLFRTDFAWYDTDLLIPTLLFALIGVFLRLGVPSPSKGEKPELKGSRTDVGVMAAGLLLFGTLLWWWDRAPLQILAIFLYLFAVAAVLNRQQARTRPWLWVGGVTVGVTLFVLHQGGDALARMPGALWHTLLFFSRSNVGDAPMASRAISEFLPPSWFDMMVGSVGHPVAWALAAAGVIWMVITHHRAAPFLAPVLLLAVWGMTLSSRFLIFSGPVMGLGAGFVLQRLWEAGRRRAPFWTRAGVGLGCLIMVLPGVRAGQIIKGELTFEAPVIAGLREAGRHLPEEAWIWSLWEVGHPARYWAGRRVIFDGHVDVAEAGERLVYNALPFTDADPYFAARFMRYYASHGFPGMQPWRERFDGDGQRALQGLRGHLSALPPDNQWRDPPYPGPVFLFLYREMFERSPSWFEFGSWNFSARAGDRPFRAILEEFTEQEGLYHFSGAPNAARALIGAMSADPTTGEFRDEVKHTQLRRIAIRNGPAIDQVAFDRPDGFSLLIDAEKRLGYLMAPALADSTFVRLWFFQDPPPGSFEPVLVEGLDYQLWRPH